MKSIITKLQVLLSNFYLNDHTLGFHPECKKLEPPPVQPNKQNQAQESTAQFSFE